MCPACLLSTGLGIDVEEAEVEVESPDLGGRYRLGDVLGEGGFGTVYRAEQIEPVRREVAVKILKPGMAAGQVLARFEAERQALAMMEHPNIAGILDAGESADGRPYFVMELVDGPPITEHCAERDLSLDERLLLFQKVTDAVAHAHQKGIIHRDLKPSNILVSKTGEPSVIDFGVAKALAEPLTDRTLYTKVHQAIGTPAYMSPEQCGGRAGEVDTRSDVYALGAVLYELLAGRPPFTTDELGSLSYAEMVEVIRDREPPPPAVLNNSLPAEMNWIAAKALAKEPQRRYSGAGELGAELGRFLGNEPLAAGPPSRVYALRKLVRRHRPTFAAGGIALLALIGGLIASLSLYFKAESARAEVEEGRDALQRSNVQRDLNDGANAAHSGRAGDAVAHFCNALRNDPDNEVATSHLLGLLLNHRWVRPLRAPVALPEGAGEPVAMIADAERGRGLLLCEGGRLLTLDEGEAMRVLELGRAATGIALSADGESLVAWQGADLSWHHLQGGAAPFEPMRLPSAVTLSDQSRDPRARTLLLACKTGEVMALDLKEGRLRLATQLPGELSALAAGEGVKNAFGVACRGRIFSAVIGEPKPRELGRSGELGGAVEHLLALVPGHRIAASHGEACRRLFFEREIGHRDLGVDLRDHQRVRLSTRARVAVGWLR